MRPLTAVGGGIAGALSVTLMHEAIKRLVPQAPRMDLLGMNAISKSMSAAGHQPPSGRKLFTYALVGDLVGNALYYSAAGIGKEKNIWLRSALLGLTAGIGAVALPGPLGLEEKHSNRSVPTKIMTVGLYVAGAMVTAGILKLLARKAEKRRKQKIADWEKKLVTSAIS